VTPFLLFVARIPSPVFNPSPTSFISFEPVLWPLGSPCIPPLYIRVQMIFRSVPLFLFHRRTTCTSPAFPRSRSLLVMLLAGVNPLFPFYLMFPSVGPVSSNDYRYGFPFLVLFLYIKVFLCLFFGYDPKAIRGHYTTWSLFFPPLMVSPQTLEYVPPFRAILLVLRSPFKL